MRTDFSEAEVLSQAVQKEEYLHSFVFCVFQWGKKKKWNWVVPI